MRGDRLVLSKKIYWSMGFVAILFCMIFFSSCNKDNNGLTSSSSKTSGEKNDIQMYIEPYLGVVLIDQFGDNMSPSADDLISFYSDSNKIFEEKDIKEKDVESFITNVFNVDVDFLRSSDSYNSNTQQYTLPVSRMGNAVDISIIDVEVTQNGSRYTFEYCEDNGGDSVNVYTYVLDIENIDGGLFKFVSGKNINTEYGLTLSYQSLEPSEISSKD